MINSKKFEYVTEKILYYIKINDKVVVYKETTFIDNKEVGVVEGITTIDEINSYNPRFGITHYSDYELMDNDVVVLHKKCPTGLISDNYSEQLEKLIVNKPYTLVSENKNYKDRYDFYSFNYFSESLTKLDGEIIPNAVYLDYIKGFHNGIFNLEEVLKYLKTRDDVRLLEDKILDIPYYNANYEENKTKYLKIVWMPINYTLKENEKRTSSKSAYEALNLDKFLINGYVLNNC